MKGKENYAEYREKAIGWLNSKRDFNAGLTLLQETGYKPTVTAKIARWGANSKLAKEKLIYEIRGFIKAWANPGSFDDDSMPETISKMPDETTIEKEISTDGYPVLIRRCYHEFYELMKQRREMHAQAAEIETNDSAAVEKRNTLFTAIETLSSRMDTLWKAIDRFKKFNDLPDESLFNPVLGESDKKEKTVDLPDDIDKLKSMKKNESIKIVKARNMLLYQTEKKQKKENPMPEGPKRIKYEKKIEKLLKLISQIDLKIANLG